VTIEWPPNFVVVYLNAVCENHGCSRLSVVDSVLSITEYLCRVLQNTKYIINNHKAVFS